MTTKQPDWEAIERAFRAGSLSVRAIADVHGISHAAISKRAKKEGWQRDLSDKVRSAVKAKVTKAVTTTGYQSSAVTDEQIIDEASDKGAAIVLGHQRGWSRWSAIAEKLSAALESIEVNEENIGDFSRALNAGVDAQTKVVKGERQAYNLDAEEGDKTVDTLASLMDELSKDA
ncbi:hypothetical protein VSO52_05180 [Pseudomonas fulva]|uniref:hypothetical protein n=1 Tax=Pseudomonas fulva TaxID=47880 RepID=UPI002DB9F36B|nr:hypothetical protein [Pseudomonas fulva]MEC4022179.1 hypothetical protein [Pseudomonas fulva]